MTIKWTVVQLLAQSEHSNHGASLGYCDNNKSLCSIREKLGDQINRKKHSGLFSSFVGEPSVRHFESMDLKNEDIIRRGSSLFETLYSAWRLHQKLILSPDDIWIAFQLQFARYMTKHAPKLKKTIVNFEGKQQIVIDMTHHENDWPWFMSQVINQLNVHADDGVDVHKTFVPNFSESTDFDTNMKNLAVMENMKHYFDYLGVCDCGITEVGLIGSLDDWNQLRQCILEMKKFDVLCLDSDTSTVSNEKKSLTEWINEMIVICDGFIATYKNEMTDHESIQQFWNSMMNKKVKSQGSGHTTLVSGWILSLLDYKAAQTDKVDIQDIKETFFNVPVTYIDLSGKEVQLNIVGGFTGTIFNKAEQSWRPHRSYGVIELIVKNNNKSRSNKN